MYIGSFHFEVPTDGSSLPNRLERSLRHEGAADVYVEPRLVKFKAYPILELGYFGKRTPLFVFASGEVEIDPVQKRLRCRAQVRPVFIFAGCVALACALAGVLMPLILCMAAGGCNLLGGIVELRRLLRHASQTN